MTNVNSNPKSKYSNLLFTRVACLDSARLAEGFNEVRYLSFEFYRHFHMYLNQLTM